jgi:hypothetical protein
MQTFILDDCDKIKKEFFAATKCRNDFSCLTGGTACTCKVSKLMAGKILFMEPMPSRPCEYKISFGTSIICNCPVRRKLYQLLEA